MIDILNLVIHGKNHFIVLPLSKQIKNAFYNLLKNIIL